jgi:hypothetical protein
MINKSYLNKKDVNEIKYFIKRFIKEMVFENPQYVDVYGWNNIIENHIWHKLKEHEILGNTFPSNLYKVIREIMFNEEMEKFIQK